MKRLMISMSVIALVMLSLVSCRNKKSGTDLLTPASSGRPYEVTVVMADSLWNRPAGRAVFAALDTDVPGLPQSERSFHIYHMDVQDYDQITKLSRNLILADINPKLYTQTKYKYRRDVYSSPQMILIIQSPDEKDFTAYVNSHKNAIVDFFTLAEMNREIDFLKEHHNKNISDKVKKMFGCDINIPEELRSIKIGKDFLWASTNTGTADMNFAMYSYPYISNETFTKDYFIAKRDSFMKVNIPGEKPNMYMATDTNFVDVKNIVVKNAYAMEARGLWEMEHDMMGGPFVSHSSVDTVNNRVVVVEGFIYAPETRKRDLIRKMEASLYTLQLPIGSQKSSVSKAHNKNK